MSKKKLWTVLLLSFLSACGVSEKKASIVSLNQLDQDQINQECNRAPVLYSNLRKESSERRYFLKSGELCYAQPE